MHKVVITKSQTHKEIQSVLLSTGEEELREQLMITIGDVAKIETVKIC